MGDTTTEKLNEEINNIKLKVAVLESDVQSVKGDITEMKNDIKELGQDMKKGFEHTNELITSMKLSNGKVIISVIASTLTVIAGLIIAYLTR
jgi:peptidoglycan hydrolase CwlO-like protein